MMLFHTVADYVEVAVKIDVLTTTLNEDEQ
jgi:hypothetical protein